ncbi:hypothetical protein ASC77_11350 [Nocardioides sp. Root1257]|uniref:hypothetical protein n=1 Tax=unclassified Nocardioides TaxID=2615069 RepID=UPI0006FBA6F7|nr:MULTISPECIES: hypothetical protein [unclassified Nocardioides]KQW49276.1 hypothetical protein ASC77_11350 [Nocardioides sp. Root1257]KRC48450.1 hypothetical protein ASE24_11355 [Nocardioides sp. Root224]
MEHLTLALARIYLTVVAPRPRDERGDVPGWVMITVMTAGLVVGITAIAGPALQDMVSNALNKVK